VNSQCRLVFNAGREGLLPRSLLALRLLIAFIAYAVWLTRRGRKM
jgi:hypothetical protein